MATSTTGIFGYSGSLGSTISARSRREPKYSKQKQTRMICAILSRRMMSPPSYEEVSDYVDSNVTYAENKREVLAVFGERSRRGHMSDKDMREGYCTSLHNSCASNGLDTCQIACDECKNPAACRKAERIAKEIKKHGRELTHFEQMEEAHAKEAKRKVKKAKYSTGQIVTCREGYELQCGFSGAREITQVKAYPDYVMYGITGKAQGFVEEDWIEGVTVKKAKVAPKPKEDDFQRKRRLTMEKVSQMIPQKLKRISELEKVDADWARTDKAILQREVGEYYKDFPELCKTQKATKPFKPKKKSVFVMFKGVRKHRMRCPICGRSAHENFCIVHSDVKALDLETSKKAQKLVTENLKYQKEHEKKMKKTVKPPKPTPAKATPKKKKVKTTKPSLHKKALPKKLHPKTLTGAQIKHARKYGYVNVTIEGVKKRVTQRNYAPRKRTVQWYRSGGKVCLKVMRK